MDREARFRRMSEEIGHSFEGEIKLGGNYAPLVQHHDAIYISGQIPRVGDRVVMQGAVGDEVSLEQGQLAAKICVMRATAILLKYLGSLERVKQILRMTVYVQSSASFIQHSEVADGASGALFSIFGNAAIHSRTSLGVIKLPKNASVEIDFIVAVNDARIAT